MQQRQSSVLDSRLAVYERYSSLTGLFPNSDLLFTSMHSAVAVKDQITIPSAIRRKLGIRKGTRIHIEVDEISKRIILTPITRDYIHSLRGRLGGRGLLKALLEEKELEKHR